MTQTPPDCELYLLWQSRDLVGDETRKARTTLRYLHPTEVSKITQKADSQQQTRPCKYLGPASLWIANRSLFDHLGT